MGGYPALGEGEVEVVVPLQDLNIYYLPISTYLYIYLSIYLSLSIYIYLSI